MIYFFENFINNTFNNKNPYIRKGLNNIVNNFFNNIKFLLLFSNLYLFNNIFNNIYNNNQLLCFNGYRHIVNNTFNNFYNNCLYNYWVNIR